MEYVTIKKGKNGLLDKDYLVSFYKHNKKEIDNKENRQRTNITSRKRQAMESAKKHI